MNEFAVKRIGTIGVDSHGMYIQLAPEYAPALAGLRGFRYLNVLWWFDRCDNPADRGILSERSPYRAGPDSLGVFATRSPRRPNPLALSCVAVADVDVEAGRIYMEWIDADEATPVLDIKPYTPSLDRVELPGVPEWCSHWPACVEASGDFDWQAELNG